jgi:opacity protein-like surface antigen
LLALFAAAGVFMAGGRAPAQEGFYIAATGGGTFPDDLPVNGFDVALDNGYAVLGAIGYDFGTVRLELEGGYRRNDGDLSLPGLPASIGGTLEIYTGMANILVDIAPSGWTVSPYIGAGLGAAHAQVRDIPIEELADSIDDETVFAYQFMAGLSIAITGDLALGVGYRYFAAPHDTEAAAPFETGKFQAHSVEAGLRFTF